MVCCPSVGGAVRTAPGVSESLTGTPSTRIVPRSRMLDGLDHVARDELRVAETSPTSRTEPHGTPAAPSVAIHSARVRVRSLSADRRPQLVVARHALPVGREPRIRAERVQSARPAERAPLLVVADRDHEVAVARGERLVRHDRRMTVAQSRRRRAGREVVAGLIGEQRRRRVEHADVDVLPAAGASSRAKSAIAMPCAANIPDDDVGDGDAETERRAVGRRR